VRSESSPGQSGVTVTFADTKSPVLALQEMQAAVNLASTDLPIDLPRPPTVTQTAGPDSTVVTLAVTTREMSIEQMSAYVESTLGPAVARADGVGALTYHGLRRPAVRIELDPKYLGAVGMSAEDVRSALIKANANGPQGRVDAGPRTEQISSNSALSSVADVRSIVLQRGAQGALVRVGDVAHVYDGAEQDRDIAWLGGRNAVMIDVEKAIGANVVQTVESVRAAVGALRATSMPVDVELLADSTHVIKSTIHELEIAFLISVILVFLVVLAFVRSAVIAFVPCLAIPLSICPVFIVMVAAGYSIDVISLLALILAVGFVVDDAILVTERIMELAGKGAAPREAAIAGLASVAGSVVTMTTTLAVVVSPFFFFPGMLGQMMREFGLVTSVAVVASAFAALTFIPVACVPLIAAGNRRGVSYETSSESGPLRRFFARSLA
jgi:multidrug efflux pump subunit AcrB